MLSSDVYFKPYGLPEENPDYFGYRTCSRYEYLEFNEDYCIDDYILCSQIEID